VVSGYLHDHSDTRHVDEVAKRFVSLGDELDARAAVLFTAPSKRQLLAQALAKLESLGWARRDAALGSPVWFGPLPHCHNVRSRWYRQVGTVKPALYADAPSWASPSPPVIQTVERLGPVRDTLFDPAGASLLLDDGQDEAPPPTTPPWSSGLPAPERAASSRSASCGHSRRSGRPLHRRS
jgi:hypothetical protein